MARKRLLEYMGLQLRRAVLNKENQLDMKSLYLSKRGRRGWLMRVRSLALLLPQHPHSPGLYQLSHILPGPSPTVSVPHGSLSVKSDCNPPCPIPTVSHMPTRPPLFRNTPITHRAHTSLCPWMPSLTLPPVHTHPHGAPTQEPLPLPYTPRPYAPRPATKPRRVYLPTPIPTYAPTVYLP